MIDTRESDGTVVVGTHGNGVYSSTITDALPVQLVSFIVRADRMNAKLKWRTESEVDNYGFEIERRIVNSNFPPKADGPPAQKIVDWENVGFVEGAGTSTSPKEYSYVDRNLSPGRYAYRIRQVDNDGSFAYTGAVEVELGLAPREFTLSQNYPNPFNPTTTIEFTLPQDGRVVLKIYDLLGREVATLFEGEAKAGYYQKVTFDAGKVGSGVYIARLEYDGNQLLRKMLLMK